MPLRGVYILNFGEISVKIPVLGILYPYRCTDWGGIWHRGVDLAFVPLLRAKLYPHQCNMSPLWGEKLHVMLLVTIQENSKVSGPLVSKIV